MIKDPASYSRRVLLAVTGLSPQVVTETLYALTQVAAEKFLPTEVRLITTAEGAERAVLALLSDEPGWFSRLVRDYGLPKIAFDKGHIHALDNGEGTLLDDIRSPLDNECAANCITEKIRELTADSETALHVSIAGGRKTVGFYAGYALSLFGRPQDRLSHVLVSPRYESHPDFFYPTPYSRIIHTPPPDSRPMDTRDARVDLADIPFVSLRHGLPETLVNGSATFGATVDAARSALGPPELVIDLPAKRISAAGRVVDIPAFELAFLSLFAKRRLNGLEDIICPVDGVPERAHASHYLAEYRAIIGEMGDDDRTAGRLQGGMDKTFFEQTKAKFHRRLKRALGPAAEPYLIQGQGRRPMRYGLDLPANTVRYEGVPRKESLR